jgi:hypothetical protein
LHRLTAPNKYWFGTGTSRFYSVKCNHRFYERIHVNTQTKQALPLTGLGDKGSAASAEFLAMRSLFLALVYELNEQPGFPRKELISSIGNLADQLETDGASGAAALLDEVKLGLIVNLGD